MTVSDDLLLAILAMDSYNRGYEPGISGLGEAGRKFGGATIMDPRQLPECGRPETTIRTTQVMTHDAIVNRNLVNCHRNSTVIRL
jgi:hypothetical protein